MAVPDLLPCACQPLPGEGSEPNRNWCPGHRQGDAGIYRGVAVRAGARLSEVCEAQGAEVVTRELTQFPERVASATASLLLGPGQLALWGKGIEYLAALERLNVYRNRISSLAEVFRLRSLTELAEVDFRLNPVVESKPDYRLSVVHTLPRLRQLDDRPVREREREASRLHFASEESLDSTQSFAAVFRVERPHHSRAKCTDPSAKKGLVMDADDEAVLNLIAECEWDLSNPPGSMSSSQQEQEASFQSSQAESQPLSSPESAWHQCGDALRKGPEMRRSGSSGGRVGPRTQDQRCGELPPRHLAPCPGEPSLAVFSPLFFKDHLRQHLDRTLEESSSLKSLLFSVKKEVRNADTPSTLNLQITGLQTSVERLSGEIVELKQHLEHYDRIHELTQMLQESHRCLPGAAGRWAAVGVRDGVCVQIPLQASHLVGGWRSRKLRPPPGASVLP
ncbi:hypothetical protein E2I00_009286 [Balaenoptera physalus]|uniref:U2A'/phosphoprotein 32 family A C-terminal domain-containing protein n=1 Tax=Balaenoptera physalus TaxID=9770 RepID=A0A643BQH2_BALPH|nr:hypothetical protein E2I00_009286 [Balaenoptera physalus]